MLILEQRHHKGRSTRINTFVILNIYAAIWSSISLSHTVIVIIKIALNLSRGTAVNNLCKQKAIICLRNERIN